MSFYSKIKVQTKCSDLINILFKIWIFQFRDTMWTCECVRTSTWCFLGLILQPTADQGQWQCCSAETNICGQRGVCHRCSFPFKLQPQIYGGCQKYCPYRQNSAAGLQKQNCSFFGDWRHEGIKKDVDSICVFILLQFAWTSITVRTITFKKYHVINFISSNSCLYLNI